MPDESGKMRRVYFTENKIPYGQDFRWQLAITRPMKRLRRRLANEAPPVKFKPAMICRECALEQVQKEQK